VLKDCRSFGWRVACVAMLVPVALGVPKRTWAADSSADLQEVVVTARKRTETLQDAPVAITAISGKQLDTYGILQMEDMANLAGGGVLISKNAVSPTLSIRGVSSDSTNAGFDQSVGIIIDGVFYDRSRWTQMGFFDLSQVEVLKGPQALYFGKSTVAGALVMTTANPTQQFEAQAKVGYEFEALDKYGEAYVSGPVSDTLGVRLAVRASSSEGWLQNLSPEIGTNHFSAEQQYDARLTLDWKPTENLTALWKFQAEHLANDGPADRAELYNCRGPSPFGTTITGIMGNLQPVYGAPYAPVSTCQLGNKITVYPAPAILGYGPKPYTHMDSYLSSLKVDWKVGAWNVTSVTGSNAYNLNEATSYVASQGTITAAEAERNTAYSEELRALSNFQGPLNVMVGADYEHAYYKAPNSSAILLLIPDPRNGDASSQAHDPTQTSKTLSAFAEVMWQITQQWSLSGGARFTDIRKDADYLVTFVNENFQTVFGFPFWLPEGTNYSNNFHDTNTSPQVTLEWKPDETLNVFASYRTGYLPGGFSLGATPQAGLTLQDFLFNSETVKGFEVGVKKQLFDRRLSLDLIGYDYKYTNLQVNLYVPATASFIVGNAGEAKTLGAEFGARWQASNALSLHGTATYNKATFQDYNTSCYTLQTAAEGCSPTTNTQDMSGKPLPRAPESTFGLGGVLTEPLSTNWNAQATLDVNHSASYQLEQTDNPYLKQDAYTRLDASVALVSHHWRFSLLGRNLTNQAIASFGATRGFTNDELAEIERLRVVALEATYNF
jgi:iron complex outermembrane recepter protein